jgi:hypothetical protein
MGKNAEEKHEKKLKETQLVWYSEIVFSTL